MTGLAALTKLCLWGTVGIWLMRRFWLPWKRKWRPDNLRRWHNDWAYVVAFVSLPFSFFVIVEALDYVPKLGKWFRLWPGGLQHFDPAQPLESLAGFVIAYGSTALMCAILYLIVFIRLSRPEEEVWIRVFFWTVVSFVATPAQDWMFRRLGLPDPHETDFAVLWSLVAKRSAAIHLGWWGGPLTSVAGCLCLAALALLGHLIWKSSREADEPGNYLGFYEGERSRLTIGVVASLMAALAWWHFGPRLATRWGVNFSTPAIAPSWSWIAWYGGVFLFVLVVVAGANRYLGDQDLRLDAREGGRFTMTAAGLLWSFLAAGGVAGVAAYVHKWNGSLAHTVPSAVLLRYAVVLAAQSASASLLLQGYIFPTTVVLYNRGAGFALSSAGYCMFFAYPGFSWGEACLLVLVGLFVSQLYWFTQALWTPIAFQVGWWLVLGPVLGFSVAPLQSPGGIGATGRAAWPHIGANHIEGLAAMILAIVFSIVAVRLLQPDLRTAPIGGSD